MILEICVCGHNKATHFKEKHTCLGMLCECKEYVDRNTPPKERLTQEMPAAAPIDKDAWGFFDVPLPTNDPPTLPMIPVAPSWPWSGKFPP